MRPLEGVDVIKAALGFYTHTGSIRYVMGAFLFTPRTLACDESLETAHGTFEFGAVVKDDALLSYESKAGLSETVHVWKEYVTSIDSTENDLLYCFNPVECWGMEDGKPRHAFAPEILERGDAYQILREGLLTFKTDEFSERDRIVVKSLLDDIDEVLLYISDPGKHTEPLHVQYFDVEQQIAMLTAKYGPCLL